jgi:hypothetical protein
MSLDDLQLGREEFVATFMALYDVVELVSPHLTARDSEIDTAASETAPGVVQASETPSGGDQSKPGEQFNDELARVRAVAQPRLALLYRSLVTLAYGSLEVFVAQLIDAALEERPGMLERDSAVFSMSDLEGFASIGDAGRELIRRKVQSVMAGGSDGWTSWLSKPPLELRLPELALDWTLTQEAIQRRHIIVHNAGRVSGQYLTRTADLAIDKVVLGEQLEVDRAYVERVLDLFLVLGARAMLIAATKQLFDDKTEMLYLADLTVETLNLRRWAAAEALADAGADMSEILSMREESKLQFKSMRWLARKKAEGIDTIREEVSAWDTGPLSPSWQLVRALLLDDWDAIETLLPKAADDRIDDRLPAKSLFMEEHDRHKREAEEAANHIFPEIAG